MIVSTAPESVVEWQLDAYKAREIDALMATYAADAQQFEYPATLLASGAAQLREWSAARFQGSNHVAKVIQRIVMGEVVIDHEQVHLLIRQDSGWIVLVAIYDPRESGTPTG